MTGFCLPSSTNRVVKFVVTALFFGFTFVAAGRANPLPAAVAQLNLELNKGRLIALDHAAASVFVADPNIADVQIKSPKLLYVFARKPGETTVYTVDSSDQVVQGWRLTVTHDLTRLREAFRTYMPEARVQVSSFGDAIVLEGTVKSPQAAEDARVLAARLAGDKNVINRLSVRGPNQINLRVRIAEIRRAVVKQIGVNWDALLSAGSFTFGLATGSPVVAGGSFLTRNLSSSGSGTADSIFGGLHKGNWDVNTLIDALESEGLVTVLAEPNLTAVSGETASFLAGGEFPIPVPQSNNNVTIEFKKFGVGLSFTPTLLSDGRINLKVQPEVSELTNTGEVRINGFLIPAITTRRAETTVELASGQSFAIAGLIQNDVNHDVRRLPGLGDLPILGALFRSDAFQRNESELVILVTPYIVRPTAETAMSAPTDGLKMPSDVERLKTAPLYRQEPRTDKPVARGAEGRRLVGEAGFSLQ